MNLIAILSALAEPVGLEALRMVWDGREHCVCELMRELGASQSHMSRHMAASRRQASWSIAAMRNGCAIAVRQALLERSWRLSTLHWRCPQMGKGMPHEPQFHHRTCARHRPFDCKVDRMDGRCTGHLGHRLSQLIPFSDWVVASTHVDPNSHLGEAISFFAYDTPKVLMLLTLVVFGMGVVRSFFSRRRPRRFLPGSAKASATCWPRRSASSLRSALALLCRCSSASSARACRLGSRFRF